MAKRRTVNAERFDNVEDFMREALKPEWVSDENAPISKAFQADPKNSWYGLRRNTTTQGVVDIVSKGWTEGVEKVTSLRESIEVPPMRSVRRRLVWTDQGDHLNMDRVYSGQIDTAWQRGKRASAFGPANITIYVDFGGNCFEEASKMVWRGIAAIVAADALCSAGHNVEIIATTKIRQGDYVLLPQIVTKAATAPLELGTVAATTALTGFFRAICLPWFWRKWPVGPDVGCGFAENVTADDVFTEGVENQFLAPNTIGDVQAAQQWVNETLATFAV